MSSEPTKTFDPRNWAFNLESYTDYETAMPYLRMDRLARWNIRKPRLNNDPAPIEKTGGVTSCLYAWGDPAFAPYINKRYVLRLSGASKYKVRFSGSARQIKASKDRIVFAVNKPGVWKILFKGPKGPVPNDFDIQIVKEEWEHLLDDASVPDTDARKIFSPDFLNQLQEDRPQSLRFMKPQSTEDQDIRKVSQLVTLEDRTWFKGMPLEAMVALCNHVKTGFYFCQWHRSGDDLIRHCADYVARHLSPELPVVIEHYNEIWNGLYSFKDYFGAVGVRRIGKRGDGKAFADKGGRRIRIAGGSRSLKRIFKENDTIAIGGRYYYLGKPDDNKATFDTVQTHNRWNLIEEDVRGADWYYCNGFQDALHAGWIVTASNTAQIWAGIFDKAGQRQRLTCALGAQIGAAFQTAKLLESEWWKGAGDYSDPRKTFDAVVVNPYIGATFLNPDSQTRKVLDAALSESQAKFNMVLAQLCLGTHRDKTLNEEAFRRLNIPRLAEMMRQQREMIGSLRLMSYEGGTHITHRGMKNADAYMAAFSAFLQSSEAEQVFEAWAQLHVEHLDGPIMQFHWMGRHESAKQHYAMRTNYDYRDDGRIRALRRVADQPKWW